MLRTPSTLLGVAVAATVGVAALSPEAAAKSFYDGKTLTIMIPFGATGGTGAWVRAIEPHLVEELGKGASIQMVAKPGGGGIPATNEFFQRVRPDGLTVLVSSGSSVLPWMWDDKSVRFDYRKHTPVVAQAVGGIVFGHPKLGKDPKGWQGKKINAASITIQGADSARVVGSDILGLDINWVFGYRDNGEVFRAVLQGEAEYGIISSPGWARSVSQEAEAGNIIPLFTLGAVAADGSLERDAAYPDLLTPRDIYKMYNDGKEPSGTAWDAYKALVAAAWSMQKVVWFHGDAPEQAKKDFTAAFERAVTKPDVQAKLAAEMGDYPFYFGEEVGKTFFGAADLKPEVKAWIIEFLNKHGAKL